MSNPPRSIIVTPTVESGPWAGWATLAEIRPRDSLEAPWEVASTPTWRGFGLA